MKHPKQRRDLLCLDTHTREGAAEKAIIQIKQVSKALCVIYFITLTLWHEVVWDLQQGLALLREDQDQDSSELRRKVALDGDKATSTRTGGSSCNTSNCSLSKDILVEPLSTMVG